MSDSYGDDQDFTYEESMVNPIEPVAASVSGEAEPVAWVPRERASGHLFMQYVSRKEDEARVFVERESRTRQRLSNICDAVPLYTHPAAARGVTEITDAMAIAAMREFSAQKGESHDAMWSQMDAQMQAEVISEWRYILAAARDAE